jgi:hypothetical protein
MQSNRWKFKKHCNHFHFVMTNPQSWLLGIRTQRHKKKEIAKSKHQMD